ncbi:MAG: hypothetical protein JNL77_02305 [Nitrosomonas sp.]|nr:hypothetical protein [Nitrosomonas sp.]
MGKLGRHQESNPGSSAQSMLKDTENILLSPASSERSVSEERLSIAIFRLTKLNSSDHNNKNHMSRYVPLWDLTQF